MLRVRRPMRWSSLHVASARCRQSAQPALAIGMVLGVCAVVRPAPGRRRPRAGGRSGRVPRAHRGWTFARWTTSRDTRAVIACLSGERVAVFRYDGDAVGGLERVPAPERPARRGQDRDDCIVCPWHGYEYRPDTGASPPPFTEKIPTFKVRIADGRVLVDPRPNPPGTHVEPARIEGADARVA